MPNVTIRDVTERPETLECGSNFLAGTDPDAIVRAVDFVTRRGTNWIPPAEYEAVGGRDGMPNAARIPSARPRRNRVAEWSTQVAR